MESWSLSGLDRPDLGSFAPPLCTACQTQAPPFAQASAFGSIITAKDVVPKILWLRDRMPDAWDATRWLLDWRAGWQRYVALSTGSCASVLISFPIFRLTWIGLCI